MSAKRPTKNRQAADSAGRYAEDRAALVLHLKGWDILAKRVKTKLGEIDLIARRDGMVAFVEVKWRADAATLKDSIDEHRLSRVAAAAELLFPDYAQSGDDMRIDVMLVAPGRWPRHMEHVWMG
jgi:putative endonuclease